jgi:hypothetical protein
MTTNNLHLLAIAECARRVLDQGPDWHVFKTDNAHKGGLIVTGGIPRILAQGPAKGQHSWRDIPKQTCIVSDYMIRDAEQELLDLMNREAKEAKRYV